MHGFNAVPVKLINDQTASIGQAEFLPEGGKGIKLFYNITADRIIFIRMKRKL